MSALLAELARAPARPRRVQAALPAGTRVGGFELGRALGRGVYEAHGAGVGGPVALKLVSPAPPAPARELRLVLEAEAAARLSHPNLVALLDLGSSEHGPHVVRELLRGETVAARLARGPLPRAEALRIAIGVAHGLAHAHAAGVVHRALAPGTVFLCEDGGVKLLDLGMAPAFGREEPGGGWSGCTAPEQRLGLADEPRVDVYALGALLLVMLGGVPPEVGVSRGERLAGRPGGALGRVVERMLARFPPDRFHDAGEALAALERALPACVVARRAAWAVTAAAAAAGAAYLGARLAAG